MIPDGEYLVRERWPLRIKLAEAELTGGPPAFPTFHTKFIDRHIRCRAKVYEGMGRLGDRPGRVLETFGGLGFTSSIIRGELKPNFHQVWEWYPALADHLRANGFHSRRQDSFTGIYNIHPGSYDLIDADFGRFTVHSWRREPTMSRFVAALFSAEAQWVVTTDEANAKLHLHLDRYGAALGEKIETQHDYVYGLSALMYRLYGYSVLRAVATHGATTLLWTRTPCLKVWVEEPADGPGFVDAHSLVSLLNGIVGP